MRLAGGKLTSGSAVLIDLLEALETRSHFPRFDVVW
jgi:hypothetical protein